MFVIARMLVPRVSRVLLLRTFSLTNIQHFHRATIWGLQEADDKVSKARQLLPQRFKIFDERNNEIVYEDEELDVVLNTKQRRTNRGESKIFEDRKLNLRGKQGVFDIHELVKFVNEENMKDVAVIQVPRELKYCQQMVICTAHSVKHVKAFIQLLNKVYKVKKNKNDPFLLLESDSNDWRLVDMQNIILHVMLQDARDFYDLESLWTIGWQFDEKAQKRNEEDPIKDIISKHIEFLQQQQQQTQSM